MKKITHKTGLLAVALTCLLSACSVSPDNYKRADAACENYNGLQGVTVDHILMEATARCEDGGKFMWNFE